jgi:rubrerythrin
MCVRPGSPSGSDSAAAAVDDNSSAAASVEDNSSAAAAVHDNSSAAAAVEANARARLSAAVALFVQGGWFGNYDENESSSSTPALTNMENLEEGLHNGVDAIRGQSGLPPWFSRTGRSDPPACLDVWMCPDCRWRLPAMPELPKVCPGCGHHVVASEERWKGWQPLFGRTLQGFDGARTDVIELPNQYQVEADTD